MIYFDNAATSLMRPNTVAEAMTKALTTVGIPGKRGHGGMLCGMKTVEDTRALFNELFHGEGPEQIVFTSNATESLNIAIQGMLQPGDHVITTVLEHNSVLRPLYLQEERGVNVTFLPADDNGEITAEDFEDAIRPDTEAVICTHASHVTGNMLDLYRIGEICNRHKLHFIVDASQTAGIFPIDMEAMHISVLCFTGHKSLMGPQGVGGMCVKKGVDIRPLKVGGSGNHPFEKEQPRTMPQMLEAGTLNLNGIAGLDAALLYIKEQSMEKLRTKERLYAKTFYEAVKRIPGVKVYGDFTLEMRAPIVALNIKDINSWIISEALYEKYGIATRGGYHHAPLMHESFGTEEQGMVRFSFSHFNTMDEVKVGIQAVKELAVV